MDLWRPRPLRIFAEGDLADPPVDDRLADRLVDDPLAETIVDSVRNIV